MTLSIPELAVVIANAPWRRKSMLCKASHVDTMPTLGCAEVPEDGFDEDELEDNSLSTSWVIRKTFLELEANKRNSLKMNLCKTDSWLIAGQSTTAKSRLYQESSGSKACDSNCSTRESSTEDVCMKREKSVRFAAREDIQEVQHLSSSPKVIKFSSLKSDYSPYCCRTRSASQTDDLVSFGNILSTKTDYSPMSVAYTGDGMGFMMSSSSQAVAQTVEPASADPDDNRLGSCQEKQRAQPTVSMSSMVVPMAVPFMVLSPCAVQPPRQPAFHAPPGDFSSSIRDARSDCQELDQQQRVLHEQRRRLLFMSNTCSSNSGWKTSPVRHPASSWCEHQGVKHQGFHQRMQTEIKPLEKTTVILRNLPEGFSREMTIELLNSQGLAKKFNFIYVPVRFGTMAAVGYAFVNFVSPDAAEECHSKLEGFSRWRQPCDNVMSVVWSESDQGLAAIIERHRNSPVMHESVQEKFKPALYKDGVQCAFPRPTKRIRPPRTQRYKYEGMGEHSGEES